MNPKLRLLVVEDNEADADLLVREIERGGYSVRWRRVQDANAVTEALAHEVWDLVISDFSMPQFGAGDALRIVKAAELDLPFIIVSGTVGEETAVEALQAGADDFLVKGRLARLMPAIARELREAESRRAKRRAEQLLRESEAKYRRILETAQEGVWATDGNGRTTYVNRRMAEMLGAGPDELAEASILDFVDPSTARRSEPVLTPEEHQAPEVVRFLRRDGRVLWGMLSTSPIWRDDGTYAGMLAMVTDVSEQRRLQAQVMESDRMASVGMLAAGVAHEINNPLFAILANLDAAVSAAEGLARPRDDGVEELRAALRDAREAAVRLRDIARDLKVFSRASEPEATEPVDLRAVLESCLRMAQNEIRHRALVVTEFARMPPVRANESRLAQVFLNLLVNAAQAIPEGAAERNTIRVTTRLDASGGAAVEIADTGIGIDQQSQLRLFTPFFTTKAAGVGTGLGLSISHRIVTALGGMITVESRTGRGTVFRVSLPASLASEPARSARTQRTSAPSRRGRILVVDDEPLLGRVLARVLRQDHDVTVVNSGRTALHHFEAGDRYDVVVCDLMMPDLSGMDLHERLSQMCPEQADRMLFMTGGAFTERARAFLVKVRNPCLEKPFDPEELRVLVGSFS